MMLNSLPWQILFAVLLITFLIIIVLGIIAFRIAQRDIGLAMMLLQIDGLVQIIIDNMILGGLFADVLI